MESGFRSESFEFVYKEDHIENTLLWESHCHAHFEMIAVLEGDINILLEGRRYRLTPNHVVIVPPLFYHTVTANKKGSYCRLTVSFDSEAIPSPLRSLFLQKGADLTIFFSPHTEELKKICLGEDQQFFAPLAESLMVRTFYRDLRSDRSSYESEIDESLRQMIAYIDYHIEQKITLDELAAHVALSKSSVCHLFGDKMKVSPKKYIIQKKLAFADKLIRDGLSPSLAAIRIGYDNYSNFYRMYIKYFDSAPSKLVSAKH